MKQSTESLFIPLCFGFIICGVVTVVAGPLLPVLATRWGLHDAQSGWFFLAQFVFSTAGAILSPLHLRRNLTGGYALIAGGLLLLSFALGGSGPIGRPLALTAFSLTGLGIGLSVTATNLHVGSVAGTERAHRLSVVNLFWGVGAVACPSVIAAAERARHLTLALLLMSVLAAGTFAAVAFLMTSTTDHNDRDLRMPMGVDLRPLAFFALFLFLYVGTENALGGWIATYAHRFNGTSLADASLMVSLYWLALLGGRGLGSLALRILPERAVLFGGLLLALAALIHLLSPHGTTVVMADVAAAGMGFGPLFPIGISRMLGLVNDARRTGWVFALSATGGAALPLLTGQLSTRAGSLRVGFLVPCTSLTAIFVLAVLEKRALRDPALALTGDKTQGLKNLARPACPPG